MVVRRNITTRLQVQQVVIMVGWSEGGGCGCGCKEEYYHTATSTEVHDTTGSSLTSPGMICFPFRRSRPSGDDIAGSMCGYSILERN